MRLMHTWLLIQQLWGRFVFVFRQKRPLPSYRNEEFTKNPFSSIVLLCRYKRRATE